MKREDWWRCWQYLSATCGSHHTMFHHTVDSQIAHKIEATRFSIPSQYRIWGDMLPYRDIHCSWSVPKPSLDVLIRWYELPYASFCHSLVSPRHFPPRLTLKMHTKCVILSTLSVQKLGCSSTMRGIHCLWSVSKPSLGAPDRWEELRCASICRL